jgi:hypothetical protein
LEVKELDIVTIILNIYDPYVERIPFWESLVEVGALIDPHILISGDLNITIFLWEVWGKNLRKVPQSGFFFAFLEKHHLVDVELVKLMPTWRNF